MDVYRQAAECVNMETPFSGGKTTQPACTSPKRQQGITSLALRANGTEFTALGSLERFGAQGFSLAAFAFQVYY